MADRNGDTPRELFLIDGNSLAYRAFFALPESIATSDGRPTNAIFGFASMLVKILTDYGEVPTVVVWDAGMSGRKEISADYKAQRSTRPDLLKLQWPHLRPLVDAFGYSNVSVEGYEADDVIATLAEQAKDRGIPVMVVSGDRDAYQLVEPGVRIMTTSRGITDTKVYDTQGVIDRYGIPPELVPDFIGLKGDTSDNIPGVPGIGDKTAGQLISQYGSLEEGIDHADELSPPRRKNITEHAAVALESKDLATMRRDLDIEWDPDALVLSPPDRSQLREMFRRFEFRNLLNRIDLLDDAVPAAERPPIVGTQGAWREGLVAPADGDGYAVLADRAAAAGDDTVTVGPIPFRVEARVIAHDAKTARVEPLEDTMLAAYLIEPGRAEYLVDDLAAEYGVEVIPDPAADEETTALVKAAETPRRLAPLMVARLREREVESLYREVELPLTQVLAAMEDAGVKIDTYRMGEITARLADMVEELEARTYELAGEEFMIGSTQQVARILFGRLGADGGAQGGG